METDAGTDGKSTVVLTFQRSFSGIYFAHEVQNGVRVIPLSLSVGIKKKARDVQFHVFSMYQSEILRDWHCSIPRKTKNKSSLHDLLGKDTFDSDHNSHRKEKQQRTSSKGIMHLQQQIKNHILNSPLRDPHFNHIVEKKKKMIDNQLNEQDFWTDLEDYDYDSDKHNGEIPEDDAGTHRSHGTLESQQQRRLERFLNNSSHNSRHRRHHHKRSRSHRHHHHHHDTSCAQLVWKEDCSASHATQSSCSLVGSSTASTSVQDMAVMKVPVDRVEKGLDFVCIPVPCTISCRSGKFTDFDDDVTERATNTRARTTIPMEDNNKKLSKFLLHELRGCSF
jgi:hypothetical protein